MVPFEIATGRMDYAQNVLIRVHTDAGLEGLGECSAFPMIIGETQDTCLVIAKNFARMWKHKDPLDIQTRLAELDAYIAGNTTIKSAFDMALYDLAAKSTQIPLYQYLGGQSSVLNTDITVGIDTPQRMAATALQFKQQGAHTLKVKVGKEPDQDIARIAAIRATIGPEISIRIDANQGWSFEEAWIALKGMEPYGLEFCEQPMRAHDDGLVADLRKLVDVPLMADESCYSVYDVSRLAKMGGYDYINIKLAKSGGIFKALAIQEKAAEFGIPCMMGGMLESKFALTAMAHLASAADNIRFYDLDTCLLGHLTDPVLDGVIMENYALKLTDAPGIGASVDPAFLNASEQWRI